MLCNTGLLRGCLDFLLPYAVHLDILVNAVRFKGGPMFLDSPFDHGLLWARLRPAAVMES
jgi:hypothetical protein